VGICLKRFDMNSCGWCYMSWRIVVTFTNGLHTIVVTIYNLKFSEISRNFRKFQKTSGSTVTSSCKRLWFVPASHIHCFQANLCDCYYVVAKLAAIALTTLAHHSALHDPIQEVWLPVHATGYGFIHHQTLCLARPDSASVVASPSNR
jgi:hypothetical protein